MRLALSFAVIGVVLPSCTGEPSDVHGPCAANPDCVTGNCSISATGDGVCTVAAGSACSGYCIDPACAIGGNTCEQSCATDADCQLLVSPVGTATHRPCVRTFGQPPGQSGWCRIPCGSSALPGARCPTGWICDPWAPPSGSEWSAPAYACNPS